MLHEILQDPDWACYENLSFFLSIGKYDTIILTTESKSFVEEFLILGEPWKDQIEYLKEVIIILTQQFLRDNETIIQTNSDSSVDYRIYIIVYITPNTGRLIGIGIRIITKNSTISSTFALNNEDRLLKAMYLITRGLLKSSHHKIEQIFRTVPL